MGVNESYLGDRPRALPKLELSSISTFGGARGFCAPRGSPSPRSLQLRRSA